MVSLRDYLEWLNERITVCAAGYLPENFRSIQPGVARRFAIVLKNENRQRLDESIVAASVAVDLLENFSSIQLGVARRFAMI